MGLPEVQKVVLALVPIRPSALHESQSNVIKRYGKMTEQLFFGPRMGIYNKECSLFSKVWRLE